MQVHGNAPCRGALSFAEAARARLRLIPPDAIGLAAFIVPYMSFYTDAMLLQGAWFEILHAGVTAVLGVPI